MGMESFFELNRPLIHVGSCAPGEERERWVLDLSDDGTPMALVQEYETPHAHRSGKPYVRPGRVIPADEFRSADLPKDVRIKLYKFLEERDA